MCFSFAQIENLLIVIVVICAVLAIVRILLPYFAPTVPGVVFQILNVLIGAAITIAVIIIVFDLLACLFSGGGLVGGARLR